MSTAKAELAVPRPASADPERSPEAGGLDVSVVVLVSERPAPLADLYREYSGPLVEDGLSFEFVFVLEPWNHDLAEPLGPLQAAGEPILLREAGQTLSEASLLAAAAPGCRGKILVAMPAYRRVSAQGLLPLIDRVRAGADLAVARRWPRLDSPINRLQTRLFHAVLGGFLGTSELRDVASGVRAMRADLLNELPLYGDLSRFLPLVALKEGYQVEEVDAEQHLEDQRVRVYGPGTYLRRLIDMLGVFFVLRFSYKPLRFFGLIGSTLTLAGAAILGVMFVQRLGGRGIADRPLLLLGPGRRDHRSSDRGRPSDLPAAPLGQWCWARGCERSRQMSEAVRDRPLHIFTVDLEDYFQVGAFEGRIPRTGWEAQPRRIIPSVERLLEILARHDAAATFFSLGWIADRYPKLIRQIAQNGHEIGSHGWWHTSICDYAPGKFRDDVRAAKDRLEMESGQLVRGFRAPNFSVVPGSEWALDVLIDVGYEYDSSMLPIQRRASGYPGATSEPHLLHRPGGELLEVPVYGVTRSTLRQAEAEGRPGVFYIHPWEIDPDQPKLQVPLKTRIRHYRGLKKTARRLERLLGEFRFTSVERRLLSTSADATPPEPRSWQDGGARTRAVAN